MQLIYKVPITGRIPQVSLHKFSIKDFFSKCEETADLVTFTEEIVKGKLQFLCSVCRNRLENFTNLSKSILWPIAAEIYESHGKLEKLTKTKQ